MNTPPVGSYPEDADVARLGSDELEDWVDSSFLRRDPYAFQVADADFGQFARAAATEFQVEPHSVFLGGSGATGLSFNPDKMSHGHLKRFDGSSDLDLIVISGRHFDEGWMDLRRALRKASPDRQLLDIMNYVRKRHFQGALVTTRVLPHLSAGVELSGARQRIGERASLALNREVDVNFWIYRDYWGARDHILDGVIACKKQLLDLEESNQ